MAINTVNERATNGGEEVLIDGVKHAEVLLFFFLFFWSFSI